MCAFHFYLGGGGGVFLSEDQEGLLLFVRIIRFWSLTPFFIKHKCMYFFCTLLLYCYIHLYTLKSHCSKRTKIAVQNHIFKELKKPATGFLQNLEAQQWKCSLTYMYYYCKKKTSVA